MLLYVAALCSQNLCAQPRVMGVEEMFRLADENSRSVQVYATGKEAASEALKTARNQRLPDITASVSGSYWGNGKLWDRDFGNAMKIDMPHWGNNFSLEVQQMIYTGGAATAASNWLRLESGRRNWTGRRTGRMCASSFSDIILTCIS